MTAPSSMVSPGLWGFVAFFVLALALYLLMRNMNARMRRMSYRSEERQRQAEQEAGAGQDSGAGPDSGTDDSGTDDSGTDDRRQDADPAP